jgi:FkbM family methyltransferase
MSFPRRVLSKLKRTFSPPPPPPPATRGPATPTAEQGARLRHLKSLGFSPKVILDGGAFVGKWTKQSASFFPGAQFVMIEPNPEVIEPARQRVADVNPTPIIIQCAIGEQNGTATLNVWEKDSYDSKETALSGSSLLPHVMGSATRQATVAVRTLADIANEIGAVPDLVKLDLQGFEGPALRGAGHVLGKAELFLVEFGCLEAYIGRTNPRELFNLFYDHNYRLYDIVSLGYRPYDQAMYGGDFMFVHRESKLVEHKGFF